MALHRYWRIYITESTSGSNVLISLYEVEMRASKGGLDQCSGGVVSASHTTANAVRLFDDNPSSYWVNGAPAEPTWFQYDFGAGSEVDVQEVRLLPRYASQAPQSFSLQYSDNGVDWLDALNWNAVSGWVDGVEMLFSAPAIIVSSQHDQPFAVSVTTTCLQGYYVAILSIVSQRDATYAICLESSQPQFWDVPLSVGLLQPYAQWLESDQQQAFVLMLSCVNQQAWKHGLQSVLLQLYHAQVDQTCESSWSLYHRVVVANHQSVVATWSVPTSQAQEFTLLRRNGVSRSQSSFWNLSSPARTLYHTVTVVSLDGVSLPWERVTIRYQPGDMFWSAQLHLAHDADFGRMHLDDLFTLQVGGESFLLLVDGKQLHRPKPDHLQRILTAFSPTVRHDFPRASAVTAEWNEACWARDVVETLLGETVVWELPEWRIAANRLRVNKRSPLQIVQTIAAAAGGVVQTNPAGKLVVRPRFPLAVPDWSTAVPSHVLTDETDILEIREERQVQVRVDRVVVGDKAVAGEHRHFDLKLDQRHAGSIRGSRSFAPGETAHLVLTSSPDVKLTSMTASAGMLMAAKPTSWLQTEEVAFVASNQAKLSTATIKIVSVLWLGVDLGLPMVQEDGVTLLVSEAGSAIARITYQVVASSHALTVPLQLQAEVGFPLLVAATGETVASGRLQVAGQRGNATSPILEILEPILSDYRALRSRVQTELDKGEPLQSVTLIIVYRSGLEVGQLVEVQDGYYGRNFRAMIVGVDHKIDINGLISQLLLFKL